MSVAAGAVLEFTLSGANQLTVNGDLTFASGSKINVDGVDTPPPANAPYNLIAVVGSHSLVDGGALIDVPANYAGFLIAGTNGVFKIVKLT
jgi:hypothetical protein